MAKWKGAWGRTRVRGRDGGRRKRWRTHAEASLATTRAVVILERTDDDIVGVGDGEGALEVGGSRRHLRCVGVAQAAGEEGEEGGGGGTLS